MTSSKLLVSRSQAIVLAALATLVTACGGGSSDTASPTAKTLSVDLPTLSANQQAFEEFLLSPGEGSYGLHWYLFATGAGTSGVNYLFSDYTVMSASPLTSGPQTTTQSAPLNLTTSLALVTPASTRVLKDGVVLVVPFVGLSNTASYVGDNIRVDALASDGVTVAYSAVRSDYETVALTGPISATPTDLSHFHSNVFLNPAVLDSTTTYAAGSKYIKFKKTNLGDRYNVGDCGAATTGPNISPCRTNTTLTSVLTAGQSSSSDGVVYHLADGSVRTVGGVSIWVANNPRPVSATKSATVQYRIYFELNGNVYTGSLIKDGTLIGENYYIGPTSTEYLTYDIRLNKAAHDSLKAAVKI